MTIKRIAFLYIYIVIHIYVSMKTSAWLTPQEFTNASLTNQPVLAWEEGRRCSLTQQSKGARTTHGRHPLMSQAL